MNNNEAGVKAYNRKKIYVSIISGALNLCVLAFIAFTQISVMLDKYAQLTSFSYLNFLIYIFYLWLFFTVFDFPFDYYSGYLLEKRFSLSNQNMGGWLFEKIKGALVSILIGMPLALVFFFLINSAEEHWWLYFSAVMIFVSVILARLAPVLIFPLFYDFTPVENPDILSALTNMAESEGIKAEGIYSFNLSKTTKKANAGFTGTGKTKRIILSDTLLENFSTREIESVFAHEIGHRHYSHILKNLVISSLMILVSFYICNYFLTFTLDHMGRDSIGDLSSFPLILFYLSVFGMLLVPGMNALSRHFERQADHYALLKTGNPEAFISAMERLAGINMADTDPHPLIEFFLYSHPSIKKRIDKARNMG